jgi:hypothetical protein
MTTLSNTRAWLRSRLDKGATVEVHVSRSPHERHYVYAYLPAPEGGEREDITERLALVAGLAFDEDTRAIEVRFADSPPGPHVVGALADALHGTKRALVVREVR